MPIFAGEGEGEGGAGASAGDRAGRAGGWASAMVASRNGIVSLIRRTRESIARSDLMRNRGKSNITPIMATLEPDFVHRLVGQIARFRQRLATRGHGQDAPATGQDFAFFKTRPGMEHLDVRHFGARLKTGDFLPCLDFARIAG